MKEWRGKKLTDFLSEFSGRWRGACDKEEGKDTTSGFIFSSSPLFLAILPVWFMCLSQRPGQVQMKLKDKSSEAVRGMDHVRVYNLPRGQQHYFVTDIRPFLFDVSQWQKRSSMGKLKN